MNETDKAIVRCWSAVVAGGGAGTGDAVAAELARRGLEMSAGVVAFRLASLRALGQLPQESRLEAVKT